jgi:hypothetical protein
LTTQPPGTGRSFTRLSPSPSERCLELARVRSTTTPPPQSNSSKVCASPASSASASSTPPWGLEGAVTYLPLSATLSAIRSAPASTSTVASGPSRERIPRAGVTW